jgi:DNA repair protein RadA/Sms
MGFCPQCGSGSLREAVAERERPRGVSPVSLVATAIEARATSGIPEVDRVLGGGVVPGAVMLLGGEPGVGKSTLLLQWASRMGLAAASPTLLVSAEESPHQVAIRAERIGASGQSVMVSSETSVDAIVAEADRMRPALLVVDSIQTVEVEGSSGGAGGPSQVREAASRLVGFGKRSGTPVMLIGHVTKDGSIAGPKLLEHMVDVVMYLEGDAEQGIRFLRSVKNRFGSVNEVGVFEMREDGLAVVADPSSMLVADRDHSAPGSVLFPTMDGRRAMLVEVQALTVGTSAPQPRRNAKGIPIARLHQVLAVLERHAGVSTAAHDVYLSVMGGVRVTEPAADLAMAVAVASAVNDVAVGRAAAWGEVGLTGEVRSVTRAATRRAEAVRFGVECMVSPEGAVATIGDALRALGVSAGSDRHLDLVR